MSQGSHVTDWSGAIETTGGTVNWALFGSLVLLSIPLIQNDDSDGDDIVMDTPFPASIRPGATRVLAVNGVENGSDVLLRLSINSDGSASARPDDGGPFQGTGEHGIKSSVVFYFK